MDKMLVGQNRRSLSVFDYSSAFRRCPQNDIRCMVGVELNSSPIVQERTSRFSVEHLKISLPILASGYNDRFQSFCRKVSKPIRSGLVAILFCSFISGYPILASAQVPNNAASFYHGKVLTILIPAGAAGGYEVWASTLRPYLEKTLGVARIDLVNKAGGGGLIGENQLYRSKPNGLTIGEVNGAGAVFAEISQKPGVEFNVAKFAWLGQPGIITNVAMTGAESPYKSFQDIYNLRGKSNKIVALAHGNGSGSYVASAVPLSFFGIPYKMLVAFSGVSKVKVGLLSGDGSFTTFTYSSWRPLIEAKKVVPLYIVGTHHISSLPGIPTILELARTYHLSESKTKTLRSFVQVVNLGKDFAAPPGTPLGRLEYLRKAFREAIENPAFIKAIKKTGRTAGYVPPMKISSMVSGILNNKKPFVKFLR